MRRVRLPRNVADDSPTASDSVADFIDRDAKGFARGHPAAHNRCAVRPHVNTVVGPSRRCKIQRTCADVRLQLCGAARIPESKRFRVNASTPNKNGQAAPGLAVPVESGIYIDNKALPQTAFPPGGFVQEPNMMYRRWLRAPDMVPMARCAHHLNCRAPTRSRLTMSAGALSGEPQSNGGFGSYSISS